MTGTHHLYAGDPSDCTKSKCQEVQPDLNKLCRANGWPANQKVLVCDPETGECCYCTCRGGAESTGGGSRSAGARSH